MSSPSKKITSSRELAKLAGVSHMTVSRAFRNDPSISSQTRNRILELAEQHGYQPNPIHTLHMRRRGHEEESGVTKGSIAFVHNNHIKGPEPSSWRTVAHWQPILKGMEEQALAYGFSLDEFYVGHLEGGIRPKRLNGILKARGILGMILGPPTHQEAYEGIDWDHHVGVMLTHHEYPPHLPRVAYDNLHTIHTCLKELTLLGYKRIGLCAPRKFDEYHLHAWSGSLFAHHQLHHQKIKSPLFSYEDPDIRVEADAFYAWLDEQKPDAVVCVDRAVRELVEAHGLKVPEDLAIAHTAVDQDVQGWSGYKIDREAQGKATVNLLMTRMIHNEFGVPESSTETILRGKWQDGCTTRAR